MFPQYRASFPGSVHRTGRAHYWWRRVRGGAGRAGERQGQPRDGGDSSGPHPILQSASPAQPVEKVSAPETGLGTSWRSVACVTAPMLFYQLPRAFRHMVVRKHLGPAPGWTSRAEVERNVAVKFGANLVRSGVRDGRARVAFAGGDGTPFAIEADHVIAATGFKVDMRRLGFISPRIMASLALEDTTPMLSRYFETSVPGLFTIGAMAANSFGPLLRFAYGAGFASRRLSRYSGSDRISTRHPRLPRASRCLKISGQERGSALATTHHPCSAAGPMRQYWSVTPLGSFFSTIAAYSATP